MKIRHALPMAGASIEGFAFAVHQKLSGHAQSRICGARPCGLWFGRCERPFVMARGMEISFDIRFLFAFLVTAFVSQKETE
jgi:hypothetical protein